MVLGAPAMTTFPPTGNPNPPKAPNAKVSDLYFRHSLGRWGRSPGGRILLTRLTYAEWLLLSDLLSGCRRRRTGIGPRRRPARHAEAPDAGARRRGRDGVGCGVGQVPGLAGPVRRRERHGRDEEGDARSVEAAAGRDL